MTLHIHLLEANPQKRGDLFCRLLTDLFHSLGYTDLRFNVQKAGREVDILGRHRIEPRRLVAEAKATARPVGGGTINKFVGVLDAERRQHREIETSGYCVSLAGFTATARQQEEDTGGRRVVLMTGEDLVGELIRSRIVPSLETAAAEAGRLVAEVNHDLRLEKGSMLLAHEIGCIWAITFSRTHKGRAVALIHADGEALGGELAEQIVAADRKHEGFLAGFRLLEPAGAVPKLREIEAAQESYFRYLTLHCGEIRFDGLPADGDFASRRVPLEELFVPLRLAKAGIEGAVLSIKGEGGSKSAFLAGAFKTPQSFKRGTSWDLPEYPFELVLPGRPGWLFASAKATLHGYWLGSTHSLPLDLPEAGHPVGEILKVVRHLAILAPPGSGKTTLLKRLATAYSAPTRRAQVEDGLPEEPSWFPVFLRCRQLGELARRPLRQVLFALPRLGDFQEHEAAFRVLIQEKLRNGEALVLLDGLDEISTEGDRRLFAEGIRAFLSTYPQVRIVLTSREPGFRTAAVALGGTCEVYALAELDRREIGRLVRAWYRQAGGPEDQRNRSERLIASILGNDRIRRLAASPLLLTTLLLVERWLGELPTRRSVLYGEAINVLLRTWNVQAHEPMALDEAVPQLAYLAFVMMQQGIQQISQPQLRETLRQARRQMEDLLGRARVPISEFVQRVELRSSLLVEAGFSEERGTVVPVYEFRHLTFQEYLAALAVAERYLPDPYAEAPLSKVLEPHLLEESWSEVVTLAAVLADRRDAPELIRSLAERVEEAALPDIASLSRIKEDLDLVLGAEKSLTVASQELVQRNSWLLARCLADEAKVAPELIRRSLRAVLKVVHHDSDRGQLALLGHSVHGEELRDLILEELCKGGTGLSRRFLQLAAAMPSDDTQGKGESRVTEIVRTLSSRDQRSQLLALASCYGWCTGSMGHRATISQVRLLLQGIASCHHSKEPLVLAALAAVLKSLANVGWLVPDLMPLLLPIIIQAWRSKLPFGSADDCAGIIAQAPLVAPGTVGMEPGDSQLVAFINEELQEAGDRRLAALAVGYALGAPWSRAELRKLVRESPTPSGSSQLRGYRRPLKERLLVALRGDRHSDTQRRRTLPTIPLREMVVHPQTMATFIIGRAGSLAAFKEALTGGREIYLVAQKKPQADEPGPRSLHSMGTVAEILQHQAIPNGTIKILVKGLYRARLIRFFSGENVYRAEVEKVAEEDIPPEPVGVRSRLEEAYEHYVQRPGRERSHDPIAFLNLEDPFLLSFAVVNSLPEDLTLEQNVLEAETPWQQWDLLLHWLEKELDQAPEASEASA